jgi:membrane protease YdiL (CAAX protease family)
MPSRSESPVSTICIILNACLTIVLAAAFFHTELAWQWKELVKNKKLWKAVGLAFVFILLAKALGLVIMRSLGAAGSHNGEVAVQSVSQFPVIMTIYLSLIAPVAEELVFRFSFKNIIGQKWLFIIVSSIVFGSLHVLSGDFVAIFPYLFTGFVLAFFYVRTKNIFVTILAHLISNSLISLLSIL